MRPYRLYEFRAHAMRPCYNRTKDSGLFFKELDCCHWKVERASRPFIPNQPDTNERAKQLC